MQVPVLVSPEQGLKPPWENIPVMGGTEKTKRKMLEGLKNSEKSIKRKGLHETVQVGGDRPRERGKKSERDQGRSSPGRGWRVKGRRRRRGMSKPKKLIPEFFEGEVGRFRF